MRLLISFLLTAVLLTRCVPDNTFETWTQSVGATLERMHNNGEWSAADQLALEFLKDSSTTEHDKILALLFLGKNERMRENYDLSKKYFQKVIKNASKSTSLPGRGYYGLGDLHYLRWNYFEQPEYLDSSIVCIDSGLFYAKKYNDKILLSMCLYRSGTIDQIRNNNNGGMTKFGEAITVSETIGDSAGIIRNDAHAAVGLRQAGAMDTALFHLLRGYQYSQLQNYRFSEGHALVNPGSYYQGLNQVDSAKKYYTLAEKLSEKLNQGILLCRSYLQLGRLCEENGDQGQARAYFSRGLMVAQKHGYKNFQKLFLAENGQPDE